MQLLRPILLALGLGLTLSACQTSDLAEPPVPLGDFALGLNIAVADNVQKVPISRDATEEQLETAMKKAIEQRFGRYEGTKLYNIGISIDAFALAPPGVPLVLKPKSAFVITANIWDDAAQKKLNPDGEQITVFEKLSGETVVGSGLTQTKEKQLEILAYNAAKAVEKWLLTHPEWFGMQAGTANVAPPATTPTAVVTAPVVKTPAVKVAPKPVAGAKPVEVIATE